MASRWVLVRTSERSSSARPEETSFIRTASSVILGGRGEERKLVILERAWDFWDRVTESSRS